MPTLAGAALHLGQDLRVGKAAQRDGLAAAAGHAEAAALAQRLVDLGHHSASVLDQAGRAIGADVDAQAAADAVQRAHLGHSGHHLDIVLAEQAQRLGRRRAGVRHRVRDVARGLAGAGQVDAIRVAVHRAQLGVAFQEKAVLVARDVQRLGQLFCALGGHDCRGQHDHVHRQVDRAAQVGVLGADDQRVAVATAAPARRARAP